MPEAKRTDQQPRHDLVAYAKESGALEHAVAQRDRRRQRDGIAAEQRQLHADLALRDAVAHGGHAARDLGRGAHLAREDFQLLGVAAVGLMRRQHVVVGGDDTDVGCPAGADDVLVALGRGKTVREVAARQHRTADAALPSALDQVEIGGATVARALDDAVGDGGDDRLQRHAATSDQ